MVTTEGPSIISITREAGIATQFGLHVVLEHPGEGRSRVTFVSNAMGGPIVMSTGPGAQTFVSRSVLDRLGRELSPSWVRGFFGGDSSTTS